MEQQDVRLTWDDVAELMRINALAAEQLKGLALRRQVAELERKLASEAEQDGSRQAPSSARLAEVEREQ